MKMKTNMSRSLAALTLVLLGSNAHAWELRQVTIKHVQVESGSLYISVNESTAAASGCSSFSGWLRMEMNNPNVAGITKEITSFALAAYLSQTPVDVGSATSGCVDNYANLSFIRVGDYGA
jgi:hypothetical protein